MLGPCINLELLKTSEASQKFEITYFSSIYIIEHIMLFILYDIFTGLGKLLY